MADQRQGESSNRLLAVELFLGFALSYFIVRSLFSGSYQFENLALGTETSSYQAVDENQNLIHIQKLNSEEKEGLIKGWDRRGKKEVTLVLGNSQTHSINQQKLGDVNYVELLYQSTKSRESEVLCMSIPNAGMQEFFLAYEYWKGLLPIKTLVVPVFLDDMREDGVRDVFFSDLVTTRFQLTDTTRELSKLINRQLRSYWSSNTNNQTAQGDPDLAALRETFQEKTELYLNSELDTLSEAWTNRQNVRGQFFNWLYRLRNTVFRIKANTVRKMIKSRYDVNMAALQNLVEAAIANNTRVLLYIPPIRSDVSLPYDQLEYASFKNSVALLANNHQDSVVFRNYESIVPGQYWGYKDATDLSGEREVDYMHFQFEGHRLLSDSLLTALGKLQGK